MRSRRVEVAYACALVHLSPEELSPSQGLCAYVLVVSGFARIMCVSVSAAATWLNKSRGSGAL